MASDGNETNSESVAAAARSTRSWVIVAAVAAVVLVLAGITWAVAAARDDNPQYDAAQIGWMHQGCQQWADSDQEAVGVDDEWCTSMTDWMNQQLDPNATGQNGMMGPMMWRDPNSMRATCEQWMDTNPRGVPNGTDAGAACAQMVDWMAGHTGDWDDWMRDGPMIRGS